MKSDDNKAGYLTKDDVLTTLTPLDADNVAIQGCNSSITKAKNKLKKYHRQWNSQKLQLNKLKNSNFQRMSTLMQNGLSLSKINSLKNSRI